MNTRLRSLPLQLCIYILQNNLVRELSLLLHLKEHSPSGLIHIQELDNLFQSSSISKRSIFDKQFTRLSQHKLVYKSQDSQYFKLVSLSRFCKAKGLPFKRAVKISHPIQSIPFLRAYLFAAIVFNFVRGTRYYYTKGKGSKAASIGSDAYIASDHKSFGVSMNRIQRLLHFSRTYLNRMKLKAKEFNLIECTAQYYQIGKNEFRRSFDLINSKLSFQNKGSNIRKKCAIIGEVQKGAQAFDLNLYLKNKGK